MADQKLKLDWQFGIIHFSAPQVHATQESLGAQRRLLCLLAYCIKKVYQRGPYIYRIHFGTPFLKWKQKGAHKTSSISCLKGFRFQVVKHEIELNFGTPFAFWNKKGVPKWILYIRRTTQESLGAQRRLLCLLVYCMKKGVPTWTLYI